MSRYVATLQQYAAPDLYDLEEFREFGGILDLTLIDSGKRRLRISFADHLAYRKAGEGDSLRTLHGIGTTSAPGRSFYQVENSEYIRGWLLKGTEYRRLLHCFTWRS